MGSPAAAGESTVFTEWIGQVRGQPQAMIHRPKHDRPGVVRNPRVALTQLDRPVNRGLEKPFPAFTHQMNLPF